MQQNMNMPKIKEAGFNLARGFFYQFENNLLDGGRVSLMERGKNLVTQFFLKMIKFLKLRNAHIEFF